MQRSQLSVSRSKRSKVQEHPMSTIELLHNGIQRKVSQTDYKTLYPRMKTPKNNSSTINLIRNEYSQQHMHEQVQNMKEDNRRLTNQNQKLKTNIRRQNKINELFNKRKDDTPLHSMNLEKLMELKLILESEELEQQLQDAENRLRSIQETLKNNKNITANPPVDQQITLYLILTTLGLQLPEAKTNKTETLNKVCLQLHKLKGSTRKLKQFSKSKLQQLKQLQEEIQKQKKSLPVKLDMNLNVSDTGLANLQRNKPIEQIQSQILKLKGQQSKLQSQIQNQMDIYISQKIQLYKQMDDLKEQDTNNPHKKIIY